MIAPLQPQFSLEHQPVPASGSVSTPPPDPTPSSFEPYQVVTPATHPNGTRPRKNAAGSSRASRRRKESASVSDASTGMPTLGNSTIRRIRPLACITSNTNGTLQNSDSDAIDQGQATKLDACMAQATHPTDPTPIEFPPSHVVLHPDDANNKVFLAMGRAFMSVVSVWFCPSVFCFAFYFSSLSVPSFCSVRTLCLPFLSCVCDFDRGQFYLFTDRDEGVALCGHEFLTWMT